jgi:outer membrane protein assembly factor BamB
VTHRLQRWACATLLAICASCSAPAPVQEAAPAKDPIPVPPPAAEVAWPSYHGGSSLDGAADIEFGPSLSVAWRFDAGARIANTPVSDLASKTLFFADGAGVLHALDWTGAPRWSQVFRLPGLGGRETPELFDAPLRIVDDMLIACGAYGTIYALDLKDGSLRWKTETDSAILGSPNAFTLEVNGAPQTRIVFIDQTNGAIQCLDAKSGERLWSGEGIDRCDGSPAADSRHVAYGSCASAVHIFSTDTGKMLREIALGQDEQVAGGVVLLGDSLYASTRSGRFIHANVLTAEILWSNTTSDEEALSTPAVDRDLVVFTDESSVIALDRATGEMRWRQEIEDLPSSPVLLRDVIAVSAEGTLFLLDRAEGRVVASHVVSDEISSPGLAGRYLLVGGGDGVVTAFAGAD